MNTAPVPSSPVAPNHPANDTAPGPVSLPERVATVLETRERARRGRAWWVCAVRAGRGGHGPVVHTERSRDPNAALARAWRWCLVAGLELVATEPGAQCRPPTADQRERAEERGNPAWRDELERAGVCVPARRR